MKAKTKEHSEINDPAISHSPSCVSGRVLHLTLKKKWFDMIASGEKKEEYRDITEYWERRLENPPKYLFHFNPKEFDKVVFKNGYCKNAPMVIVEFKGIDIDYSKPKWCGGIEDLYYVIKLGNVLYKRD